MAIRPLRVPPRRFRVPSEDLALRIALSFATGLLFAPIGALGARVAAVQADSLAAGRTATALGIGAAALLAALLPRQAQDARSGRALGVALALLGLGVAGLAAAAEPGSLGLAAGSCAALGVALALLCRGPLGVAAVALGTACGLLALEALVVPRHGLLWPAAGSALALALLHCAAPAAPREAQDRAGANPPWLPLALAGALSGYLLELARPYVLQHLSGARASHAAIAAIVALGAGLGAAIPAPSRRRGLFAWAALAAGGVALLSAFHSIGGAADPRALRSGVAGWFQRPWAVELATAWSLLGLGSLGAGFAAGASMQRHVAAGRVAALFLAAAAGSALAHWSFAAPARWPSAVLGDRASLVRDGVLEQLQGSSANADGVLRVAKNNTRDAGAPRFLWHGSRASHHAAFSELEAEEIRLAARAGPAGGRLLVVGIPSAAHVEELGRSPFQSFAVASALPALEAAGISHHPVEAADLRRSDSDPYDAVVVLSTPAPGADLWRPLDTEGLRRLARLRSPDGALVVWLDLCIATREVAAAVARAMQRALPGETLGAWLALDGHAGPLLGLMSSRVARPIDSDVAAPIDVGLVLGGSDRTASPLDPVAEAQPPRVPGERPLAPASLLRPLAADLERTGQPALAHVLRALALHDEAFADVEFVHTSDLERHQIQAGEAKEFAAALAAAASDRIVLRNVRRFAQMAFARKEYEVLDLVLLPALAAAPDDVGLRYLSARASFELLDFESAIDDLEAVVLAQPNHYEALVMLGLSYARRKEWSSAINALESARGLQPERIDALRGLGFTLQDAGRGDEARSYLERVTAMVPGDKEARARLARLEVEAGR